MPSRKTTRGRPQGTTGTPKTGGRKKGTPNKATAQAKEFCRGLLDDPEYQGQFKDRLVKGDLPPALESLVWHYAHGKPSETVDVTVTAIGKIVDEFHAGPPPARHPSVSWKQHQSNQLPPPEGAV